MISEQNEPGGLARALALVGLVVATVAAAVVFGEGAEYLRWIVAGVVMIGTLVVIHEFGHFLVARAFGVGTPVFSIGIGKRLWGFRAFDTDFRISLLPLGGYVQMAGADPFGEQAPEAMIEPERDFMRKPVWQRLLIMLAGPVMNLALPYALFTVMAMLGEPVYDAVIGHVVPGTAAAEAGLAPGDRVVEADGRPVEVWADVVEALGVAGEARTFGAHELVVERDGTRRTLSLPPGAFVDRFDNLQRGFSVSRLSSRVGVPDPDSPAARAGLRTGDAVVGIDGKEVSTWVEVRDALGGAGEHELDVVRIEDGERVELEVKLRVDPTWTSELLPALRPHGLEPIDVYAGYVNEGSAAERAGVQAGDRLTAIDGVEVLAWEQVIDLVARTATIGADGKPVVRPVDLTLIRDGAVTTLTFTPTWERQVIPPKVIHRPLMGIAPYPDYLLDGLTVRKYYTFGEAVARAHDQVILLLSKTAESLWNMTRRELGVTEGLSSPVAIFWIAGESAEAGVFHYVRMMGMISLSLGVVNLLPIPVLDGGHILFYLLEAIRGRPLPLAWRERIQMVGVLFLAALFVAVVFSDVSDLLSKKPG